MAESTKILNIFLYGPVTLTKAEEVRNCWVHDEGRVFCNDGPLEASVVRIQVQIYSNNPKYNPKYRFDLT